MEFFHCQLLNGKEDTLLSIIDSSDLFLARLCERGDYMHESTEQEIKAETTNYKRNRRLLDWVKQSPPEAFTLFIWSLRTNSQAHVANYIMGTPGDLPLRDGIRRRLRRIRATLINLMYTNDELLDYLLGEKVINEADYQCIRAELTLNQKNSKLLDIVLRSSERAFRCFKDTLKYVGQGHVVQYIERGEVLPIHLEFSAAKTTNEHEETLLTMLRKIVAVVPESLIEGMLPIELSEDQRKILVDSLRNLKAVIVGAEITQSILLYVYAPVISVVETVWAMFNSGQLLLVIQQLCGCLTNDDTVPVVVSVSELDYQMCKDGFSMNDGEDVNESSVSHGRSRPGRIKAMTTSEPVAYQGIQTADEICQLRSQLDELIRRQQQTEMVLNAVSRCLDAIEADSQLSVASTNALHCARRYIDDCVEENSVNVDVESTLSWVQFQDYQGEEQAEKMPVSCEESSEGVSTSYDDLLSVDTGYKSSKTQSLFTSSLHLPVPPYAMNGAKRGKFVVINNGVSSVLSTSSSRSKVGSDVDTLIRNIFNQIGFDVQSHKDCTADEMYSIMADVAQEDHSDCDCFAAAILSSTCSSSSSSSSNEENQIIGVDGSAIGINRLMEPIKDCLSLAGKPKIFFIESGRGTHPDHEEASANTSRSRTPLEADVLYTFSTSEGNFSSRNPLRGSSYIQTVCDELKDMMSSGAVDLERALSRVRYRMACALQCNSTGAPGGGYKQVPAVYSTLTKRLCLTCKIE